MFLYRQQLTEGTYFFNNQVDMGGKYEVILTAVAKNETADARGITNVQLYFRTSDTAPGTDNVGRRKSNIWRSNCLRRQ